MQPVGGSYRKGAGWLSLAFICLWCLSLYMLRFLLVVTPASSGCPQALSRLSFQRRRCLASSRLSTLDSLITSFIVNQDLQLNCWKHSGFSPLGRSLPDLLPLSRMILCVLQRGRIQTVDFCYKRELLYIVGRGTSTMSVCMLKNLVTSQSLRLYDFTVPIWS